MAAVVTIKLPKSAIPDPKRLIRAVESAMTGTAKAVKVDFDVTTQTWKDRPEFTIEKSPLERRVYTEDDIYRYVSRGTSIRYAHMSDDFAPKTRNGWIGSNKGKGGLAFISKKNPRPGIKAREFEKVIGEKWQKEFPVNLQRAIDAELGK